MGLLKNRVRTIVGDETSWHRVAGRMLFYVFHPARYRNKAKEWMHKLLHPTPVYGKWIQQQTETIKAVEPSHPIHFVIISPEAQQQSYTHITRITPGTFPLPEIQEAYMLYLPKGYVLHPHACRVLAQAIGEQQPDIVTFDSDHLVNGVRQSPRFMPAWSPVRLWFENYLDNAICVKLTLIAPTLEKLGWYNSLRQLGTQPHTAQRVMQVLLTVVGERNNIEIPPTPVATSPLVSIIIPTRNKADLVKQCIDSIVTKSSYSHYEIVLVDNNSDEPELETLVSGYVRDFSGRFLHLKAAYPFNFSQLMNDGVAHSKGEYVILLNNDTEVSSPDWIEQLLRVASHPLTGAVGAKLLYPDDTIQHAGIVLSPQRISQHIYLGKNWNEPVYDNALNTIIEYSALTAACLMVSRAHFEKVGGFNVNYRVEYNDLDFCLRLQAQGLHNVFAPLAKLYHYESASRQHPMSSRKSANQHYTERALMIAEWLPVITHDPYHHPNRELFGLA